MTLNIEDLRKIFKNLEEDILESLNKGKKVNIELDPDNLPLKI